MSALTLQSVVDSADRRPPCESCTLCVQRTVANFSFPAHPQTNVQTTRMLARAARMPASLWRYTPNVMYQTVYRGRAFEPCPGRVGMHVGPLACHVTCHVTRTGCPSDAPPAQEVIRPISLTLYSILKKYIALVCCTHLGHVLPI